MFDGHEFIWLAPPESDFGCVFCPLCMRVIAMTVPTGQSDEAQQGADVHHVPILANLRVLSDAAIHHILKYLISQHRCPDPRTN